MDRKELREKLTEVLEECGYYQTVQIDLHKKDGRVILKYLDEYEIRGIQVLVHDKVISHEDYYLTETFNGETQKLFFNENGTIREEFKSEIYTVANNLLYKIL